MGHRYAAPAVLFVGVLALPSIADAAGLGFAVKYAHTTGNVSEDEIDDELDISTNGAEIGAVLDTNVTGDSVFNYRLALAFKYGAVEWTDSVPFDYEVTSLGASVTNTFGFAIVNDFDFRLSLGPSIRLAVASLDGDALDVPLPVSGTQVEAGVGAELAFTFHVGDTASLSTTVGYHAQLTSTSVDYDLGAIEQGIQELSYLGLTHHITVGVAVLFLTGSEGL